MGEYSVEDRVNMILTIGECHENCLLASRVYAQKFPEKKHPNKRVFERVLSRFRETGSVAHSKREIIKPATGNIDNEFAVLQSVIENPNTSTRTIAEENLISASTVGRILRKHKYHPFHYGIHQNLYPRDFARRMEFCTWILEKVRQEPNFVDYILFSDECTFHSSGVVNRRNFHYYDTDNHHLFQTMDRQNRWSVNVFAGIVGENVVGPYYFEGSLDGQKFHTFLQRDFWNLLEHVPVNIRRNMWFQLDGAPAHFHRLVRDYLNREFPNKWIGRGGPQNWPARSPDLTAPDFFLWGHVKNTVYSSPPTTADDMKNRIRNVLETIAPSTLRNVKQAFERRVQICFEQGGQHFEHLL